MGTAPHSEACPLPRSRLTGLATVTVHLGGVWIKRRLAQGPEIGGTRYLPDFNVLSTPHMAARLIHIVVTTRFVYTKRRTN
jgi:hypothetical protein